MHFDAPSSFRKGKMISIQKEQWINKFVDWWINVMNKILKIICGRVSPGPFSPFCSAGPERSRSLIMERWPSRSRRKSDPSEFEKSISARKLHSAVKWAILLLYSKSKFEKRPKRPNNKSSKCTAWPREVVARDGHPLGLIEYMIERVCQGFLPFEPFEFGFFWNLHQHKGVPISHFHQPTWF